MLQRIRLGLQGATHHLEELNAMSTRSPWEKPVMVPLSSGAHNAAAGGANTSDGPSASQS